MEHPDEDWYCEIKIGIQEVRMMYSHTCYALDMWPGSPARPADEQEYLRILKMRLFAMIQDYNFTRLDTDK